MCYPDNCLPLSIFITDKKPSSNESIHKSGSDRGSRQFGQWCGPRHDSFVPEPHRCECAQQERQTFLDIRREHIDNFIGASRNRSLETAKRAVGGKGKKPPFPAGLI